MTKKAFTALASIVLIVFSAWTKFSEPSYAQGRPDLRKVVRSIASEFKKGNEIGARKIAVAAAQDIDEIVDLMFIYRDKSDLGFEKKLKYLANHADVTIADDISFLAAAMAELTLAKAPAKDGPGKQTRKAWIGWADQMRVASLQLAKAAENQNNRAIETAATKLNNACIGCHSVFKD